MKEIGIKLKEKREENGVSVVEAANDLKLRPSQITSLEEGKKEDFEDILILKNIIRDYSKYLGFDSEVFVDQFNEYLFDYTSKIPVSVIERAKLEKKCEKKEVSSPYTNVKTKNNKNVYLLIGIVVIFALFLFCLIFFRNLDSNNFNNITYAIRR